MIDFQKGDRVRYVGHDESLRHKGLHHKVLTVGRTPTESDMIMGSVLVEIEGDGGYSVSPNDLHLIERDSRDADTAAFKIGDRVRYTAANDNKGKLGRIVEIYSPASMAVQFDQGYVITSVHPVNLQLVGFQAGDRVRYVGQDQALWGMIGTVVEHDPADGPATVTFATISAKIRGRFLERVVEDERVQGDIDHPEKSCASCGHASDCGTHSEEGEPRQPCDCKPVHRTHQMIEDLTDAVDNVLTRVEKLERDAQSINGRLPVGTKVRWLRGTRKGGQVGTIIGYMPTVQLSGNRGGSPERYAILFPDNEVWPCAVGPRQSGDRALIEVVR